MILFTLLLSALPAQAFELPKTLPAAQEASVEILGKLVAIDTSNPPGGELEAARLIKTYFDSAGISSTIEEPAPGRGNIVARLKSDGTSKPILLVSHLDVVGVERAHWATDPFKPVIKDGRLYGRGTSDIKDLAVVQMLAMMLVKNSGRPLHRDVIYASVADEESGGEAGMKFLVEKHWPEIEAEFAFNEGSRGKSYLIDGKVAWAALQVSERRSVNLRLVAHGTAAHSMLQTSDNPIYVLANALTKLSKYEASAPLNPALVRYREGIAKLKAPRLGSEDAKGLLAMTKNTINATIVKGGYRSNVIPTEAEATVNCRIQPGVKTSEMVEGIRKAIADPRITIEGIGEQTEESPPVSSVDSAATRAYEKVIHANFGKQVPFIPVFGAGTTDSRYLRERGVQAYALEPYDDQDQHGHGNDESISIEGLKNAVKIYYELLLNLAT
ncbi:MAG: M20/M25/M40 family metallo-hydrolase [Bdellovibrionota bacterium]